MTGILHLHHPLQRFSGWPCLHPPSADTGWESCLHIALFSLADRTEHILKWKEHPQHKRILTNCRKHVVYCLLISRQGLVFLGYQESAWLPLLCIAVILGHAGTGRSLSLGGGCQCHVITF